MKILFVWPGIYMGFNIYGKGFEQSSMNHGLAHISAKLKDEGHHCFLMDLRAFNSWEHFEEVLTTQEFDICVIGFMSVDEMPADTAIRIIKEVNPNAPIIAGGVHITYNQIKKFSLADCIVWGEGDIIISQLLDKYYLTGMLPEFVIADIVENLDMLPSVDRSLFNLEIESMHPILPKLPTPFYSINFSRGCGFRCRFCLESKNTLWKKYRVRSPENCINDIKILGNIGSLMIHDDHFPSGPWTREFIKRWHDAGFGRIPFWCQTRADWIVHNEKYISKMKEIGCTWISLGIEGSQRMLDFYNKHLKVQTILDAAEILHKNKINIFGNYILGAPTETDADIDELELILQIIKPQWHSSSIYTSYPGSKLYDYIDENDLWVGDINNPKNHYSLIRFPYERKLKGVDYDKIRNEIIPRLTSYRSEMYD